MKNLEKFGKVKYNYPLSHLTTFKIGGVAKAVVWINKEVFLPEIISYLRKISCPYYILGKGSNVLALDEGFCGVIIKPVFKEIYYQKGENRVVLTVSSGLKISELLNFCLKNNLSGLEFLAGIPGSIGGAIFGNAGAFGYCIGERVKRIKIFSPKTGIFWKEWSKKHFGYRKTDLSSEIVILKAELLLEFSSKDKIKKSINNYFRKKLNTQPLFSPSAGCVFKNPDKASAGYLIEQAGLKGKKIGDAKISEKHANFIINTGKAKAKDVLELIKLIQTEVKKQTGIKLEPEIRIIQ
ncbi:MAG: UDP-N-acetylmuramate dehydrogenase [Candidatus Desulfofervidus auxilii]|nr:UDP-N-acetylmuramate dehydrogenase [Candidatus Desulfofervidus auxilii]